MTEKEHTRRGRRRIEHWQIFATLLALYDFIAVHAAYGMALWLRFDGHYSLIEDRYLKPYVHWITISAVVAVALFALCKLYKSMWRFASYIEVLRVLVASVAASVAHSVIITVFGRRMPISYYLLGAFFQLALMLVARFSYRYLKYWKTTRQRSAEPVTNVMLIGAGAAGQMILRDIRETSKLNEKVVCVIDDNHNKWGRLFEGVPVAGGRDEILSAVQKYHVGKIYLAIPSASAAARRDILTICNETGCELKQLPGLYQLMLGQVSVSRMQDVSIDDLLGREPIRPDMREVFELIHGKTVLVTGAGGSIGSELCRQIAAHEPERLILFDVYENSTYAIQLELKEKYPELKMDVQIGSVRDSRRMFQLFDTYRPQIVYHAAAHKHVPLMEDSPCEAVKNNALGTYKTAYAAMVHGCERFVLISTDKAVNPTNIMGASKRLCEMIIQSFDAKIKAGKAEEIPQLFTHTGVENADRDGTGSVFRGIRTEFVAVRFGNVLGSNGSVIPIFRQQIARGGPVTVTHPDIIRYFMTIPEAVSLVMLAGTYAHGGEIFVLDMGNPVRIVDLARNMIRLSGFKPDVDIKIEYTGLRPGEKLYEEKLMAEEGLRRTDNELIHIGCPIPFDTDEFFSRLDGLMKAAYSNKANIREYVQQMVSTYHPEKAQTEETKDSVYDSLIHGDDQ